MHAPASPVFSISPAATVPPDFAHRLLAWQRTQGRHDLPWQHTQDPYRVWLSEVMLQQTQVVTVLAYYARFLDRFPDVSALAQATEDEVLALWSGLGYYSRARNLHRCARQVMAEHHGLFPQASAQLAQLPGIGPSTAAAIASFCFCERVSIFDGNVQRVLARWLGFDADLSRTSAQRTLYAHAQQLLAPVQAADMPSYTQGLMDLGATVCSVKQPTCLRCPLHADCKARHQGRTAELPVKLKRLQRKTEHWFVLMAVRPDGHVWLEQRPERGIWAKLLCFPTFMHARDRQSCIGPHINAIDITPLPTVTHTLTHRDLVLETVQVNVPADWQPSHVHGHPGRAQWHLPQEAIHLGLPVPMQRWLRALGSTLL